VISHRLHNFQNHLVVYGAVSAGPFQQALFIYNTVRALAARQDIPRDLLRIKVCGVCEGLLERFDLFQFCDSGLDSVQCVDLRLEQLLLF